MSDPTTKSIGTILRSRKERDAIHVATLCVKAIGHLVQGTTVKVDEQGNATHCKREEAIGIVDPFLTHAVEDGQYCWVFMFPGTITGMRHHWKHPTVDHGLKNQNEVSKKWLAQYANDCHYDYDDFIADVKGFVEKGDMLDDNFNSWEVPEEFWKHFKAVTGIEGEGHFWTCCPG